MSQLPPQAEDNSEVDWSAEAAALQGVRSPLVPTDEHGREVPPLTIIAIDPGKMSGVSLWVNHFPLAIGGDELDKMEVPKFVLMMMLSQPGTLEVVCEDFIISERTIRMKQDHNALRIIGWLELHCEMSGRSFTLQAPAAAKQFATDEKLKALDWYHATKDGHENDAHRHMLTYLSNQHHDSFREHQLPALEGLL